MVQVRSTNFAFLDKHEPSLVLLATQAERLFAIDAVASIGKLRLFAELLAQEVAARIGVFASREDNQLELLRRLRDRGATTREIDELFHTIRKAGNAAVHSNVGSASDALHCLKLARSLAVWFERSFSNSTFKPEPFAPPSPPIDATAELRDEVERLREALSSAENAQETSKRAAEEAERARAEAEDRAAFEARERATIEALIDEVAAREAELARRLAQTQAETEAAPATVVEAVVESAHAASERLELDEADTRRLIDAQLCEAGWEADSHVLRWSAGTRPQRGRNLAISEWPTDDGRADYVLFVGLCPVAVVEAKRGARDVAGAIEQAKRYARAFRHDPTHESPGPWGSYRVPFLFATNGRPYLKQLASKSGIWFLDARRPQNHSAPLDGWRTPEGLKELLKQDIDAANEKLREEPTDYLGLRGYQVRAIRAAEEAISQGQREILLAMATGTGKTRTCIGLCYRLLKAERFRRVLFLVDRSALGEQTANAFKDARLENLQTFDSIYDLKTLEDAAIESDTKLHIATVQSMVRRVLFADAGALPVDEYDCVIVDECHRGYLVDREMSDTELGFRSEVDYISKYRRVLEHFDAVKIGLTATPALHTREIFGDAVFTYGYREAVIDGYLVDHEPPVRIITALAEDGITWRAGEQVETYDRSTGSVQLALLPDEVKVEVEEFNRRVVTENFNCAVAGELAKHIDPSLPEKTLVFCATDAHADLFVRVMKEAFAKQYGEVEDDAVVKITGTADRPLEAIRRFKNERLPSVVATVDLLTTGIDVPSISNLVFLRRVKSRILYEQMLGRATRLCEDIGKEVFRIYDAVDLYAALAPYSDMKPVAADVSFSFSQLIDELASVRDDAHRDEVLGQLIAKLDRKRRRMKGDALDRFEVAAGRTPEELLTFLRENGAEVATRWFAEHPSLGELLDRSGEGYSKLLISHHADGVREVVQGYGEGRKRPDDYLEDFARFVRENQNRIPALLVVTQRPRELTRKQLKELRAVLDAAGYGEASLKSAWRSKTNQDVAASIVGHIRQAALGDALVPYSERVDRAMRKMLASHAWTKPQKDWLERIGKQLRAEIVVDREALDQGAFATSGGFARLDKIFDGKLASVLEQLNEEVWREGA